MALSIHRPSAQETAMDEQTVVHFTGRKVSLDEALVHSIRDQLFALPEEPSQSEIVLEFGNVEYISSLALGTLVNLHKQLAARGRRMTIRNARPTVRDVFAVTRLDTILNLVNGAHRGREDRWIGSSSERHAPEVGFE
jgi:anti-sigma B factor antagonist